MKRNLFPYLAGITSAFIFGLSFLFTKNALDYVNPFYFIAYRFIVAFIAINTMVILKIIKIRFTKKTIRELLPLSIIQPIVYFFFETTGISRSTSSEGGIIIATIPIFVAILSVLILKEKVNVSQFISIAIAVAGILVITVSRGFTGGKNLTGPALLLLATLSAGFYNIMSRKASRHYKPWEITYHMMFVGAIGFTILSVLVALFKKDFPGLITGIANLNVLGSAVYLGVFSSMGAFFLINYALSKIEATRSSVFAYLSTIVAIMAGVIFRNESLSSWDILGSCLILIGVWGTNAFQKISRKKINQS